MTLSHGEKNETPISRERCPILPSRVHRLLGFVQSTRKWRLADRRPLDKWNHDSGCVTLLGDACHPMLVSYIMNLLSSFTVDIL